MNDKYLWDRSGEPDAEVQKLEELLGELRYQPQPLHIPADVRISRRRQFSLPVAIAAAILFFVAVSGLWFRFAQKSQSPQTTAKNQVLPTPTQSGNETPVPPVKDKETVVKDSGKKVDGPRRHESRNLLAADKPRQTRKKTVEPRLTPNELAEKEQVLIALRIVSAKLNLAQRKTQSAPQTNPVRNQHRIG